jgi:hypothetical protein
MKLWQKIVIAVVGSGLNGGLAYCSGIFTDWSVVFGSLVLAISGAMSIMIGFPPKTEVK